jgi:hypothetical protein
LKEVTMRILVMRFLTEPAVALGVLAAAAIVAIKLVNGGALTADDLIAILAPLATGATLRPLVAPAARKPAPEQPQPDAA